jgi:hypothetical protein
MTLIAVAGGKGSPGVTTTALALAAAWPHDALVAECDPAGSDLAYRLRTSAGTPFQREPSLLSLAAACRRSGTGRSVVQVEAHCQVASAVRVLRGPLSPEQAVGLEPYWPAIAAALSADPTTVLADIGRLHPGNPALPVAAAADVILLVGRATVEGLAQLRDRVEQAAVAATRPSPPLLAVAVVAHATRGEQALRHAKEVLAHTGVPVAVTGWLSLDVRAVEGLLAGILPRRSPLLRSSRTLATALLGSLEAAAAQATASAVGAS